MPVDHLRCLLSQVEVVAAPSFFWLFLFGAKAKLAKMKGSIENSASRGQLIYASLRFNVAYLSKPRISPPRPFFFA